MKWLMVIPAKIKAIYLLWSFIHFFIFLTSGNFISEYYNKAFTYNEYFYPIDGFHKSYYDLTELLIYLALPIVLWFVIKLWKKQEEKL
jgi:hypothetical protein